MCARTRSVWCLGTGRIGRYGPGKIVPVVQEVYPIHNAEQAHELVVSNATIGKVILKVRD
ncbi:MAG: zinc-binding dehydrogenase [Gammaproteobacteria bacterium]|nr:zinc-binding dehydrogenase [Gammaproteobacteria bacterium]